MRAAALRSVVIANFTVATRSRSPGCIGLLPKNLTISRTALSAMVAIVNAEAQIVSARMREGPADVGSSPFSESLISRRPVPKE